MVKLRSVNCTWRWNIFSAYSLNLALFAVVFFFTLKPCLKLNALPFGLASRCKAVMWEVAPLDCSDMRSPRLVWGWCSLGSYFMFSMLGFLCELWEPWKPVCIGDAECELRRFPSELTGDVVNLLKLQFSLWWMWAGGAQSQVGWSPWQPGPVVATLPVARGWGLVICKVPRHAMILWNSSPLILISVVIILWRYWMEFFGGHCVFFAVDGCEPEELRAEGCFLKGPTR